MSRQAETHLVIQVMIEELSLQKILTPNTWRAPVIVTMSAQYHAALLVLRNEVG
ncbi:MAG: hypothetical protein KAW89_00250 [Armatimonadetes bacterium]|nr:hypothetical protein [Armatimonadota bacterium]